MWKVATRETPALLVRSFSFLCVVTCGASVLVGGDHRITAGVEEHRSDVSDVIDAGLESAGGVASISAGGGASRSAADTKRVASK